MDHKQQTKTLPAEEARALLIELMHDGYDTICSPLTPDGNLTITWPASLAVGKQLSETKES